MTVTVKIISENHSNRRFRQKITVIIIITLKSQFRQKMVCHATLAKTVIYFSNFQFHKITNIPIFLSI